jgi:hypothetical protein
LENALQTLDKLTNEEARMAQAQMLLVAHAVNDKLAGVDKNVTVVKDKVEDIDKRVNSAIQGKPCMLTAQGPYAESKHVGQT